MVHEQEQEQELIRNMTGAFEMMQVLIHSAGSGAWDRTPLISHASETSSGKAGLIYCLCVMGLGVLLSFVILSIVWLTIAFGTPPNASPAGELIHSLHVTSGAFWLMSKHCLLGWQGTKLVSGQRSQFSSPEHLSSDHSLLLAAFFAQKSDHYAIVIYTTLIHHMLQAPPARVQLPGVQEAKA